MLKALPIYRISKQLEQIWLVEVVQPRTVQAKTEHKNSNDDARAVERLAIATVAATARATRTTTNANYQ